MWEDNAKAMDVFTQAVMCLLGVLFMFGAFFGSGIGPAFSHGLFRPISRTGKVILFVAGTVVFIDGLELLLGRSGWPRSGWRLLLPFAALVVFALLLNSKLVRANAARVVGRSTRPMVAVEYANGLPAGLVGARIAFLVVAATMAVFGLAPLPDWTARVGIIACVLALFVLAFLYMLLEQHYISSGQATLVKLTADSPDSPQVKSG